MDKLARGLDLLAHRMFLNRVHPSSFGDGGCDSHQIARDCEFQQLANGRIFPTAKRARPSDRSLRSALDVHPSAVITLQCFK